MLAIFLNKAFAAEPAINLLERVGTTNGPFTRVDGETALMETIGIIIKTGLSLLGVIFIILIIYAGYNWMTARGEEEKVTKAKETIWRAIIGLIILVSSYAIWTIIANIL
jgi:hypothetical protein